MLLAQNPSLTPCQIKTLLINTADVKASLQGKVVANVSVKTRGGGGGGGRVRGGRRVIEDAVAQCCTLPPHPSLVCRAA